MYIHERDNRTNFRWDVSEFSNLQEIVCRKQGRNYEQFDGDASL